MFLSKCVITNRRPMNPYEIHKKIWSLFQNRPTSARDFLFRVDQASANGHLILLQSAKAPVSGKNGLLLLDHKEIHYAFRKGQSLRFMITANPTKRIRDLQGKKGNQGKCRVPLIDEDEIHDWLVRQFAEAAQLHEIVLTSKNNLYFRKKGRPGKISTVTFRGLLSVKDDEKFYDLVERGIGPAKAFGCGLISLARI